MIGGNINGTIQTKSVAKNSIGENVASWSDAYSIKGWLGYQGGEQMRSSYSAKIEESTHVFLCDFHEGVYALANSDVRMIIKGVVYEVKYIDNPDEMDKQLEIHLRRVGAWDGR